jgi:hypothetical protein
MHRRGGKDFAVVARMRKNEKWGQPPIFHGLAKSEYPGHYGKNEAISCIMAY